MIAYNYPQHQTRPLDERFAVVQSKPQHVEQMIDLFATTYNVSKNDSYSREQFLSHIATFPEGQFVVLDQDNDRVVGLTISMRVSYQPEYPLLERWVETTNYG